MAKGHLSAKVMKTLENMRQNEPRLEEEDVKALHDAVRGARAAATLCWHDCVLHDCVGWVLAVFRGCLGAPHALHIF